MCIRDRVKYQRALDGGYAPIVNLVGVLESTERLKALDAGFKTLEEQLEAKEGKAGLETVIGLHKAVGSIAGADKVKDRLNKVRRQLKKKKPRIKRAVKEFNKALREYKSQLAWREKAAGSVLPGLKAYLDATRNTIGIRMQQKMNREQSLYVAACSADHRDISLNF